MASDPPQDGPPPHLRPPALRLGVPLRTLSTTPPVGEHRPQTASRLRRVQEQIMERDARLGPHGPAEEHHRKGRAHMLILDVVLAATLAQAPTVPVTARPEASAPRRSFQHAMWYGALIGLDGLSTEAFLSMPPSPTITLREGNPVVRAMPGTAGRFLLGTAEWYGLWSLDRHLEKRGHRGWAKAVRYGTGLTHGFCFVKNVGAIRELEDSRLVRLHGMGMARMPARPLRSAGSF